MVPTLMAPSFRSASELTKPFKSFVSFVLPNCLVTRAGQVLIFHSGEKETEAKRAQISRSTNRWQRELGPQFQATDTKLVAF